MATTVARPQTTHHKTPVAATIAAMEIQTNAAATIVAEVTIPAAVVTIPAVVAKPLTIHFYEMRKTIIVQIEVGLARPLFYFT